MTLNKLRDDVHSLARSKGWYDEQETDGQFIARFVANTHAELSELWEAHRKGQLNKPCDKGYISCLEEEMADIIIRTLDACGRLEVDIAKAVEVKHRINQGRGYRHGGKVA
jgi:NTP pyrophosphatase (non-canonical NTP hydrolase)